MDIMNFEKTNTKEKLKNVLFEKKYILEIRHEYGYTRYLLYLTKHYEYFQYSYHNEDMIGSGRTQGKTYRNKIPVYKNYSYAND